MKDKEKQIEQIFNDIVEIADRPYYYDNKGHAHIDFADLDKLAEKLSEKYQSKLSEDSVVLTNDNAEELANLIVTSPQMQSVMSYLIKAWQKETAEKIINDILEFLKVCPNIITSSYTTYYEKVPLREYLIELAKNNSVLR